MRIVVFWLKVHFWRIYVLPGLDEITIVAWSHVFIVINITTVTTFITFYFKYHMYTNIVCIFIEWLRNDS